MPIDDETAAKITERARVVWGLGDYPRAAQRLEPVADAIVEAAEIEPGHEVLDVAAGSGNVALAAVARGATVTASDLAPAQVDRGRARTEAAGADVRWLEADAEALPFDDASFDRALSVFGVIFTPRPDRAAAELLRVVRPGGLAALTAWTETGLTAAVSEVMQRVLPQPPGAPSPLTWGDSAVARERLAPHAAEVRTELRSLPWTFESPEAWLVFMEDGAPPMVAARQAVGEDTWAEVRDGLRGVAEDFGTTTAQGFMVEQPYLLAVARR